MTGLLLDTHVVLWWLVDDPLLDEAVKERIDIEAEVYVSSATVWEVGIKQALGKLTGNGNLARRITAVGLEALPILADHAVAAAGLPLHHRDPFDRMLIGQAITEDLTVLTRDRQFGAYEVAVEYV